MENCYKDQMDNTTRTELAKRGDTGKLAAAIRLMAARISVGMKQKDVAKACGVSETAYNNMERAVSFPTRTVMHYLYENHRIDFNFLMAGEYSQLPLDVAERLFPALEEATKSWGQKSRLD